MRTVHTYGSELCLSVYAYAVQKLDHVRRIGSTASLNACLIARSRSPIQCACIRGEGQKSR